MSQEPSTALEFATDRHGSQMYGELPYMTGHLVYVAVLVKSAGYPELEDAAWLHDIVEDTVTTLQEVEERFGVETAGLVWAVTSEPGKNRKERNTATYPKILQIGDKAIALKLCDRICNVEECWRVRDAKLFMYQKEYRGFRGALRSESSDPRVLKLWDRLDKLLGRYEPQVKG